MRCDPPRDNLPPTFRCGDPLSSANYLRMQDESGPSPTWPPEPSKPLDHLEPTECAGKRLNEKLAQQTVILDTAARWMKEAQDYKALWLAEVLRGDHEPLEYYAVQELDKARAESPFWHKDKDTTDAILMRRQS